MVDNLMLLNEIKELNQQIKLLNKDIRKILKILNDQGERIKALENEDIFDKLGIKKVTEPPNPWEPKITPMTPTSPWLHQSKSCSKCGLNLEGVIGYVCPNVDCPVGLGPTMVGGNNV